MTHEQDLSRPQRVVLDKLIIPAKENVPLAKYQQTEWMPFHPVSFGLAENADRAIEVVLCNRHKSNRDEPFLIDPQIPSAEAVGLDIMILDQVGEIMSEAAKRNLKVAVYGDTDTDGAIATVLTYLMLRSFGIKNVDVYTPDRDEYEYGFNKHYAQELGSKYDLIWVVDCGISDRKTIEEAKEGGATIIVSDHHRKQEGQVPEDALVLHSSETSAGGLAYLEAAYLAEKYNNEMLKRLLPGMLAKAAIAVYVDNMPMTTINHAIVKLGLNEIRKNPGLALAAYAKLAQINLSAVDEKMLSFDVGPAFNSPSRYGSGDLIVEMLLAEYVKDKNSFLGANAEKLRSLNIRRKEESRIIKSKLIETAQQQTDQNYFFWYTDNPHFYRGFLAPLASSVMHEVNKPVLLGKADVKRSKVVFECRSPEGATDWLPLIEKIRPYLEIGGGHPLAAGFTVKLEHLGLVEEIIDEYLRTTVEEVPMPQTRVDCEITFDQIEDIIHWQQQVAPFGYRFETPIFQTRDLTVTAVLLMPKSSEEKKHVRLTLMDKKGKRYPAVRFNANSNLLSIQPGEKVDMVYKIETNNFNGRVTVQLALEDIKQTGHASEVAVIPQLPDRKDFRKFPKSKELIVVPSELEDTFIQALSNHVVFDMDDTVKFNNPLSTALRYMCFECTALTDSNYFRRMYPIASHGSPAWVELIDTIAEVSKIAYRDGGYDFDDPAFQIAANGNDYPRACRYDNERGEIYRERLGFETLDDLWQYFRSQFIMGGGKGMLQRRIDEFSYPVDGAVRLLNRLAERKTLVSIISNSSPSEIVDFERLLRQAGFKGRLTHKISAETLGFTKPHPYSLRNLLMKYPAGCFAYIGNSIDDVRYSASVVDVENFPSPHNLEVGKHEVVPVLITGSRDYRPFLDSLPPHCRFDSLKTLNKWMKKVTN
jgi:single-stranded-DNA-specific exonuclease